MELWPVWLCDWWLLTGYTFMYDVELYDCAWLLTGYTLMYSKPWNILTTPSVLKRINKRINLERDMIPSRTIYVDTTYINLGGVTSFAKVNSFWDGESTSLWLWTCLTVDWLYLDVCWTLKYTPLHHYDFIAQRHKNACRTHHEYTVAINYNVTKDKIFLKTWQQLLFSSLYSFLNSCNRSH